LDQILDVAIGAEDPIERVMDRGLEVVEQLALGGTVSVRSALR
jgi:hypothetical protein